MSSLPLRYGVLVGTLLTAIPATAHAVSDLAGLPDPLSFVDTRLGSTDSGTVTVTNSGGDDTTTLSFAIINDPSSEFSITSEPSVVLGSGGTADVVIQFAPVAVGLRTAQLEISFSVPTTTFTVDLQGVGLTPEMVVSIVGGFVPPLSFGASKVGTASGTTFTIRVTNTGDALLNASISELGLHPGDWDYSPPAASFTVAPAADYDIVATFTPGAGGARSATLRVTDDDGLSSTPQVDTDFMGTGQTPVAALSPDPLTFADRRVFTTSGPLTVTIDNGGPVDLVVTGVALTGGDVADFGLTTSLPMTIPPASSDSFSVTFTPQAAGARSATISVTSDDPASPTAMTVDGLGEAPVLTVSPGSLGFPNTRVGGSSGTLNFTIDNTGDSDMNVLSVTIPGANADDYTVPAFSGTIAPSDPPVSIGITFNPQLAGSQPATVVVTTDNPLAPTSANVTLTGTGIAPDMAVTIVGGFVPPLNFGGSKIGVPSATTFTVRVENNGTDVLNASISELGPHPGDWDYSPSATSFSVAAGGFRNIVATFTPGAAGARSATLRVTDNDGLSPTTQIDTAFTGTGQTPSIGVAPDPLTFAGRRVFTTSGSQMVTISNTGSVDLIVSDIQLTAGDVADFGLTTSLPMTIAPAATGAFSVTFTPQAAGARSATISITSDAPGGPATITVDGTGLAPVVTVTPGSLSFPATRVGSSSGLLSFTIDNTGDSDMNVLSVSIPGANADDYSVGAFSGTITPSDTPITINVTFTPQLAGAQPATVVIVTDNPLPPTSANVTLTGTGTEAILVLTPAAGFAYGDTRVTGQSGDGVFSLENTGNIPLNVSSLTLGAPDGSQFSIVAGPSPPFAIGAGATRTIAVRCTPSSVGVKVSSFIVGSDADNAASVPTPPLGCNGVTPEIAVTPLTLAFAPQLLGTTSPGQTITVTNAAGSTSATLNVTVSKLGGAAGEFNVSPTSFSVLPGGSQDIAVTFAPTVEGARAATVRINSDDLDEDPTDVSVSGNGVKPEITLLDPGGGSISFGGVNVSTSSVPQLVRVRNDGSSNLTISGISIVGGDAGQFSIVTGTIPPPDVVLAPAATASWQVVFTPSSTGAKSTTFRITSDDADEGTVNIPLNGTGIEALLTVSPSPVSFPVTRVCETATPITVTVRNSGTADLTVSDLNVSMTTIFPIEIMWPAMPQVLAPNDTFSFALGFEPLMHSDYSGTITITSDAPGAGTSLITILGPGRITGLDLSPTTHDFGEVRVDLAPVLQNVTIKNTGTANFVVGGVSVDDPVNFTVTPLVGLPTSLAPAPAGPGGTGEELIVEVLSHPVSVGPKTGIISVTTDITACPLVPGVGTVGVGAEGVAPDMAIDPTSVNFGGHDVQAEFAMAETVTIRNSGSAPLRIDDLSIRGTFANEFGLSSVPSLPVTIPVGGTLDVEVLFQPTFMRNCVPDDGDAFVDVESDGFTVPMASVRLDGCGLDRRIDVCPTDTPPCGNSDMAILFPPTYRNPIDPPTREVTITNTGTFELKVDATMTSDADAFTITNGGATTIAPDGSHVLTVEFRPTAASALPFDGTLTVFNDDDENEMAVVSLSGRGLLPEVVCDPCGIPFGSTAVGSRTTIQGQKIHINNMNDTLPFTVRSLRLVDESGEPLDDEVFEVLGFDGPTEVPPLGSLELDVAFAPSAPGTYEARLEVFLEEDPDREPEVQTFITLTGDGVSAQARGFGCTVAAGRSSSGPWLLLFAAVFAAALRRRRWAAVCAVAVLTVAGVASADPTRNVDLDNFRPAAGGDPSGLSLEAPRVGDRGTWSLALFFDYARKPLSVEQVGPAGGIGYPVESRTGYELAFDYVLGDRAEVGVRLPLLQQSGDVERMLNVDPADGMALGDLAATGKWVAYGGDMFALAGRAELTLPTATDGEFAGTDWPSLHTQILLGLDVWKLRFVANGGYRIRREAEFFDVVQDDELTFGIGAGYRFSRKSSVVGELYGAQGSGAGASEGSSPLEGALGLRHRMSRSFAFAVGFGRGILPGIGAPQFRGFLLLAYTPGASDLPSVEVYVAPPIDRGDDDADGIINAYDKCPKLQEDYDDFEDDDGCPEEDNDGDGILDKDDACPNEPEDMDGYKDKDGCEDEDNDGDGILDKDDKCPDEVEDIDGFEDRDGCDDPDNDRDGIPDVIDQCAVEAETINGIEDDDGCPDQGESSIIESGDRVDLIEQVRFRGNSSAILAKSHNVLSQVAMLLRARPEWTVIRIGVHVHPRNSKDQQLSVRRAEAVRVWLVDWGVDVGRLEVKGYGSSRPLVPKNARKARSINDRVELVVEKKRKQ